MLFFSKQCLVLRNSFFHYQDLIHHIHCFGCIFYHQSKAKKFCWFPKFLFHDLYFESYSSNASNIFFQQNIFIFGMTYCCNIFFIPTLCFFVLTVIFYYHLPNMNTFLVLIQQILQSQQQLFNLSFSQWLICLNHHGILT